LVLNVILLYTEPVLRICLLEQKKNLTPKEALRVIKVLHKVDRLLQRCLPTGWPPKKKNILWRAGYSHLVPRPWKDHNLKAIRRCQYWQINVIEPLVKTNNAKDWGSSSCSLSSFLCSPCRRTRNNNNNHSSAFECNLEH
jgi:hypothetical protein